MDCEMFRADWRQTGQCWPGFYGSLTHQPA